MIESLENIKDDQISLRIVSTLIEMNYDNEEIINKIIHLIDYKRTFFFFEEYIYKKAINYLGKMAHKSNSARILLDDIFQKSKYNFLQENAAWQILEIEPDNHTALNLLLERYKDKSDNNSYQYFSREKFIDCLDKHPELTKNLLNVLTNCQDITISTLIIDILGIINDEKYQLEIIKVLLAIINYTHDENIIYEIALIIGGLNAINTAGNEQYKLEVVQILNQILNNTLNEDIICVAATSLSIIDTQNIEVINILLSLLNKKTSSRTDYWLRQRMPIIASQNINVINGLINITNNNEEDTYFRAIDILVAIPVRNLDFIRTLINLINSPVRPEYYSLICYYLIQILQGDLFAVAVAGLKDRFINEDEEDKDILHILWHCAQNMTYPEFYRAWHGEPSPLKNLENQFTDTHSHLSKLQPTEKTYPLTLNLKTLQNETDIIEISQEICNQIYLTACPENPEIPQIKKHLQTENLALIINNCEPNQEMIKFCNKLTDILHIAFITKQPLDVPLKGFPNQPKLLNVIQHWINEIG